MADLPATRRERIASRLSELARLLRQAATPADQERIACELDRLAVGG